MAQVTVELGNLLEMTDFELFDFDYQMDDPQFKSEIEEAVTEFYWDYEIGQETPDMFKRKFIARWKRIIGYYNELYNTTLLAYDPLMNYSISEALDELSNTSNTQDTTANTNSNGTTNINGTLSVDQTTSNDNTRTDNTQQDTDSNEMMSDYPQQPIAGGDFLNGERDTTSSTTNTGTVNDNGTSTVTGTDTTDSTTTSGDTSDTTANVTDNGSVDRSYTKTIEGLTGTSYQELIQKERQNIMRLTGSIINEMKPCFILVY